MVEYSDSKRDGMPGTSDLVEWARSKMQDSLDAMSEWRQQAIDAFGLVAGDQWEETAKNDLENEGRPVFTFNRTAGFIRGICGLEAATRNQVRFYAREIDDSGASDVLNAAVRWVRSGCDAEDEEADAFKDMLICGIGWTETLFTTEMKPEGEIVIERVDPLHMRWDASSRKRGLVDRRWNARVKYLPISTIRDVWGEEKAAEIESIIESDSEIFDEFANTPHDATTAHEYNSDSLGDARRRSGIPVVQFQYVKTSTFHSVINPFTGEAEELTSDALESLNKRLEIPLVGEKYKRREYRQLFYCGTVELEEGPLPTDGFTFQPITGIRDRNNGIWYGFVRDMLDPQRWINKFFSSMADVVASQAKGGLMAETDAFTSKERAVEDWNDPRAIVWMKPGGLAKTRERTASGIPAGFSQLLEFTVGSLPHVAGVNLEFLGLAGREQAGVLETQRKQAAISTLSEFFNALRLYRKQQGRVLVRFIDEYISDGRLIRVVGKKDSQYIPLMRQQGTLEYDIVVDEAPDSPDQKGRTWEALMQILPTASKMGFPIPPDVIEYAPFPQALIQDWQKFAQGEAGLPPEMKERMQQMQEQMQGLQRENEQLKSKQAESMAQLQMKQAEAQQELQLEQAKLQQEAEISRARLELERERVMLQIQLEREKATAEIQLEQAKMAAQLEMEQQKTGVQIAISQEKAASDASIKERQLEQSGRRGDGE